jgi:predicted O-methyltransferase YrrM
MEPRDATLLAEHFNESLRRLPGPAYYQVLRWIHRLIEPANYLEIGVYKGISLVQARPGTPCIGIDPEPKIEQDIGEEIERKLPDTTIYELTSDDFFARHDPTELFGGPVELAFIDGLHLFEQVLRDFVNVERHSAAGTLILLHDVLPLDAVTASREMTTDFYCGDVWKATLALRRTRPELEMITVRTAPTGLCIVRGLDAGDQRLEQALPEIIDTYRDLDFDYYSAHRKEMPDEIPNQRASVREWLGPAVAEEAS